MIEQIQRDATTAYFAVDYRLRIAPRTACTKFWSEIVRYIIFAANSTLYVEQVSIILALERKQTSEPSMKKKQVSTAIARKWWNLQHPGRVIQYLSVAVSV